MACSCDLDPIAFTIPDSLREHAPEPTDAMAICPQCLALTVVDAEPAPSASDVDFSRINEAFPSAEIGIAMALAIGQLDSIAMNRPAIEALVGFVSDHGTDPWLVLERLARAGSVDPDFDLDRRRRQLDQLLF